MENGRHDVRDPVEDTKLAYTHWPEIRDINFEQNIWALLTDLVGNDNLSHSSS